MSVRRVSPLVAWLATSWFVAPAFAETATKAEPPASAPQASAPEPPAPEPPAAAPPATNTVQPARAIAPVYGLKRCLDLADVNYPKVHEARARLVRKQGQAWEARTAPFSEFTFTGGLGLAPTVQGTSVYSPSSDLPITSHMGLAWSFGIDGAIPLWTFGKITNLWDAADAQVKVGEGELRKEKNELRLAVRRAYYGVLLARDGLGLLREALARVNKYATRLEERVAGGEGDEIDLLKLKIQREDLLVRESDATKQEAIALAGLRFYTGVAGGLQLPDQPLVRASHRLGPLAHYLAAARLYRPEINMARAGVLAREAQVRIERAKLFPDIALALTAHLLNAPNVTDQRNPFVRDAGHAQYYGASLALRYKLDFLPQSARLSQANAQLEEQRATERYALGGVGVEVEQAFRDAEDAEHRLEAQTRATGYAKKWLLQVQQGIDVGTSEDADIVDPSKEYALRRFAQMSATFDYNLAIARLAQVTGWESIASTE
jgi:outer membrane protein TolC